MLVEEMRAALAAAPRERLCDLSKALWQAFSAGAVSEADAEQLSELIEARRAVPPLAARQGAITCEEHRFPARKPQRPPVRSVAIERRRRLAASGPMPPALAARFTTGELAVLRIVADEFRDRGTCSLCLDAIAARAGVSRSLAKGAIREARRLGMLEVIERRRTGAKSLPNVVRVIDREWLAWISRGKRIGGKNSTTTETRGFREGGTHERQRDSGSATPRRARSRECEGRRAVGRA